MNHVCLLDWHGRGQRWFWLWRRRSRLLLSRFLLLITYVNFNAWITTFISIIVLKAFLGLKYSLAHVTFVFVNRIAIFAAKHA